MTRNLKALGLAALAVLALGAIGAQSASATNHTFHATEAPIDITGEATTNQVFEGTGVKITCKKGTLTGTQAEKTVTSQTLTPSYSECTSPVGPATVHVEGCNYIFYGETTSNTHTGENDAPVDLECNHTGRITVTASGCNIAFQDTHPGVEGTVNQKLHGVTYSDAGTPPKEDIKAVANVSTITYIATGANCALLKIKEGTHEDGKYTGTATVRGYKHGLAHTEANQIGVGINVPTE